MLEEEVAEWKKTHDTRQRIKHILIGIREPVSASQIAEQARCSPKTARKYLEELVDERIALKVDGPRGDRYYRNENTSDGGVHISYQLITPSRSYLISSMI